jgi:Flp pilus assembly pilin Flp
MTKFDTLTSTAGCFCADESGGTAVEYAILASGIGACVAATVVALGGGVKNFFTTLAGLFP